MVAVMVVVVVVDMVEEPLAVMEVPEELLVVVVQAEAVARLALVEQAVQEAEAKSASGQGD